MTTVPQSEQVLRPVQNGIELSITVVPRSSRDAVAGLQDNRLKIKIRKPPVDGQANAACCRFLADIFGTSASKVTVVRGHNSRRKTIRFDDLRPEQARDVLKPYIQN